MARVRCEHWVGAEGRYCGASEDVHPFLQGPACPLHTPAALAGLPEPGTRPQPVADTTTT